MIEKDAKRYKDFCHFIEGRGSFSPWLDDYDPFTEDGFAFVNTGSEDNGQFGLGDLDLYFKNKNFTYQDVLKKVQAYRDECKQSMDSDVPEEVEYVESLDDLVSAIKRWCEGESESKKSEAGGDTVSFEVKDDGIYIDGECVTLNADDCYANKRETKTIGDVLPKSEGPVKYYALDPWCNYDAVKSLYASNKLTPVNKTVKYYKDGELYAVCYVVKATVGDSSMETSSEANGHTHNKSEAGTKNVFKRDLDRELQRIGYGSNSVINKYSKFIDYAFDNGVTEPRAVARIIDDDACNDQKFVDKNFDSYRREVSKFLGLKSMESHTKSEGIGGKIKMGIDYNMFMRMCASAAYLDDNEDYWDALWEYYSGIGEIEDALVFFDNLFQYTSWCDADEVYDEYLDDKFKDESKSKEECIQAAIDEGDLDAYKSDKGMYLVIP